MGKASPVDSARLRARFSRPHSETGLKRIDENRIAVMDTTLRDGEQTPDISYFPAEKLQLARLLLTEVGVDRIEIASTRVSEGEREAARLIADWARRCSVTAMGARRSTGFRVAAGG